jgi:hypothetical protein
VISSASTTIVRMAVTASVNCIRSGVAHGRDYCKTITRARYVQAPKALGGDNSQCFATPVGSGHAKSLAAEYLPHHVPNGIIAIGQQNSRNPFSFLPDRVYGSCVRYRTLDCRVRFFAYRLALRCLLGLELSTDENGACRVRFSPERVTAAFPLAVQ